MRSAFGKPSPAVWEVARQYLNPAQQAVFLQMPQSEQEHALRVFWRLWQNGHKHPDLLTAALLHDVGKAMQNPRLWERVLWVIGQRLFPKKARQWGKGTAKGWRRAFAIASQHPQWGAQIAKELGAAPEIIALIKEHHSQPQQANPELLRLLQWADNQE